MAEETPLSHILPVLRDLTAWLAAEGVSGALIGGVAASFQSRPRFTRDIDAIILLDEAKWAAFLKAGAPFGFVPRIPDAVAAILEAHPNLDTRRIRRMVRGLATALESPDLADNLRRLLARRPKGRR